MNLSGSPVKVALATGLMTDVMGEARFNQLPTCVLPAVIPMLVDVERAVLSRKQNTLLMHLPSSTGSATGVAVAPQVLYGKLPQAVRDEVPPLDFEGCGQALIETSDGDDVGYTDVRPRPQSSRAWPGITWT